MSPAAHKHLHLIKGTLTRNRLPLLIHALLVGLLISVPGSNVRGGSTGKIAGLVQDVLTGEGIAGANIIIERTYSGAATDAEGSYVILNVPPGIYAVQATVIGYTSIRSSGVRVSVDFTTQVDFQLGQTVLQLEALSIVASRPIIQKDRTSTLAIVWSEELAESTPSLLKRTISLTAGMKFLFMRIPGEPAPPLSHAEV